VTKIGTPKEQGERTDWKDLYEYIQENPDINRIAEKYPEYCIKYYNNIEKLANNAMQNQMKQELLYKYTTATPRPWQEALLKEIAFPPDDRTIIWYYDSIGNHGKTWLSKYLLLKGEAAYFTGGKSADIAFAYKCEKIVIFDFSRTLEEHINYQIIEQVKNGLLFSSKYASTNKVAHHPWVICMANFKPNFSALSKDRWSFRILKEGLSTPTDIPVVESDLANLTM